MEDVGEGLQEEEPIPTNLPLEAAPVAISGGDWQSAVFGNQYNENVHVYSGHGPVQPSAEGWFKLGPGIIVYEKNPISSESRIFRGKLLSQVLGDREIAVKLLQCNERQLREAKNHFLVPHHDNIVERILTDTFSYRGQLTIYIAMECCDDQNLHDYVISQARIGVPFDPKKYLSFAFQVADGMDFLHRHSIMNRDVKPENLLLACNKTKVKISDFGLSKQVSSNLVTQSFGRPGTDGWRAPEVLKQAPRVSIKCDIFPMGLIFHFLWSYGKHPFGDDPDSWNHYIKRGENRNLDRILIVNPDLAKDLLVWMLEMEPEKRPTTKEILMHQIFSSVVLCSDPEIRNAIDEGLAKLEVNPGTDRVTLSKDQLFSVAKEVLAKTEAMRQVATKPAEDQDNKPVVSTICWEIPKEEVVAENRVANGGYSEIWKGNFNKVVAIKKCNLNVFSKERLSIEAETLKSLQHENIIKLIGVVTGKPFMVVFEFAEYGSLDYFLRSGEGKLSTVQQQITMVAQVASGMAHIEKMKFIHRLLRARFVMVAKDKVCKISTFGRALYVGDAGECRMPLDECDAVAWMAPETIAEQRYSIKTDVWSFGILLSEILTKGHIPYPDWTDDELKTHIENGDRMPKQPNWPPRIYEDVMLRCWHREPRERPSFSWLENYLRTYFIGQNTLELSTSSDIPSTSRIFASEQERTL